MGTRKCGIYRVFFLHVFKYNFSQWSKIMYHTNVYEINLHIFYGSLMHR